MIVTKKVRKRFREYAALDPRLEGLRQYAAMLGEECASLTSWDVAEQRRSTFWRWLLNQLRTLVGDLRAPPGWVHATPPSHTLSAAEWRAFVERGTQLREPWQAAEMLCRRELYTRDAYEVAYHVILEELYGPADKRQKLVELVVQYSEEG